MWALPADVVLVILTRKSKVRGTSDEDVMPPFLLMPTPRPTEPAGPDTHTRLSPNLPRCTGVGGRKACEAACALGVPFPESRAA